MNRFIKFSLIFAAFVCVFAMCVSASSNVFSVEAVEDEDGIYKVTSVVTKENGLFAGTKTIVEFDNTIFVPVHKTKYTDVNITDGKTLKTPVNITSYYVEDEDEYYEIDYAPGSPRWNVSDTRTTLTVETYYTNADLDMSSGALCFEMFFRYADGKSSEDLVSDSFVVKYIKILDDYANTEDVYEAGASANTVTLTNNVVPAAPVVLPITISVVAGDKVYLQDGSVVNIDADNDAYEVPATLGYVAVNSGIVTNNGFIAQKTYYIDGTNAIPVHDNAIYGTGDIDLRAKADDADRNGLRFRVLHSLPTRSTEDYEVTEIGFIMAAETERFITKFGSEYDLTLDKTGVIDGVTYAKIGLAYGDENGNLVNKVFDRYGRLTGDENIWDIRAVMFNIPEAFYQTTIAARPYYKIGEAVVYGEVSKMTLYDAAKAIKADATAWEGCNDDQKAYIDEVIAAVEGPDILVEDEIIINIGSLYE